MSLSTSGRTWEQASSPSAVRLARRFEADWRRAPRGRRPDPGDYLSGEDVPDRAGARLALLRVDMGLRWEAGEPVAASWYRARLADLGADTFVALVYEEFCQLEDAGAAPDRDEFLARYAEVAEPLARVLDIHGLVGSGQTTDFHAGGGAGLPFPQEGETIGGFRLVEELGRGAFARVFLAQERQLADRPVALKVARAGSREPQTLARLQHTHIVPVYSSRADPATGLHLLCMPYYGRVTLARVLADPKVRVARSGAELVAALDRLGASEPPSDRSAGRDAVSRRPFVQAVAWWGARMAEALEHAHERGVLHRDVKPSNVLVTADAMPMLLDFNLAREAPAGEPAVPGGTLDYMAPEHIEEFAGGDPDRVDARSDVFGLGVLLYESVAGARPFPAPRDAVSASGMLLRAAEDRRRGPPPLRATRPEVPAAFDAVVRRCLAPEPEDRYASAAEVAADLQAVADGLPLRHASEPWPDRLGRWVRRRRRALLAAAPIVAALAVVIGLLVRARVEDAKRLVRAERQFRDGVASERAEDYGRAMVQFQSAVRLIDDPAGADPDSAGAPSATPSAYWASLAELRQRAETRHMMARRTARTREAADAFFADADDLRFLLSFLIGDLAAASRDLLAALEPFHVFAPDDWRARPDMTLLAAGPRARLGREVDEMLFLWALALDKRGGPEARARAEELCQWGTRWEKAPGPWSALRARLERRRTGAPRRAGTPPVPETDPTPRRAFQWGALALQERRRGEAVAWFQKAVRLEPENYWYQYYLGHALDAAGRTAEALGAYRTALALKPGSPWVRFGLARYERSRGAWAQALEDFRKARDEMDSRPRDDREPDFARMTRLEVGLARQSLGDLAGARAEYDALIAEGPRGRYGRAARLNRAKLDADSGAPDRARAGYDELLADDPSDREARLGRALLALRAGAPSRAESDLSALLAAGAGTGADAAGRAEVLEHRALARLVLGRATEAASDVEQAAALQTSPRLERLRTRVRIALGRTADVRVARPEDLAALPVNGRPLRADLIRLVEKLRRVADGIGDGAYGAATLQARLTLASVLSWLGDPAGARSEADRAVALAPLSGRTYLTRARVAHRAGRSAEALGDAERARQLEPDDPRTWTLRGELRVASGDGKGGLADLDRAIALGGEGDVRAARAAALAAVGDAREALRDWETVLARDPSDPFAYLGRAEVFLALHQPELALADLEQAAGWADGRPGLGPRLVWAYARCLALRPGQAARLAPLVRNLRADRRG